jgi:hypothetical protein
MIDNKNKNYPMIVFKKVQNRENTKIMVIVYGKQG